MAIQFTQDQQKVLDARNHNILVSAAAGSGKTAVLVERIVRLITEGENPPDIDRLLVVTFTKAAASQMRERIGKALSARLRDDPGNTHLQRQEVLLHNAQITTIDSFCSFLLRNYFSEIDLEPGFRQMEDAERSVIEAQVLEKFLEDKYEEKNPDFLHCVDYFCTGAGSDDKELVTLLTELCKRAGSHPSPEAWLKERSGDYDIHSREELFAAPWMRSLIMRSAGLLLESESGYAAMQDLCLQPDGPEAVWPFLEEERRGLFGEIMEMLRRDPAAAGPSEGETEISDPERLEQLWEAVLRSVRWSFPAYPRITGKKYAHYDRKLKETVKAMRDREKKTIQALKKNIDGQTAEMILAMMDSARGPVRTLSSLALEYRARLQEEKKQRHMIDFVDLEHFALDILAERKEDGTYVPRRVARALRSHYAEILIDEYQDSNEVQEVLLQIISGEDEGKFNRFMVGDIKQSIYRFRLARPEIFMEKYDLYRHDDPVTERIDLDQNFRSRAQVLDCVNDVFMRIMRREIGGVDYDESVSLKKGTVFPDEIRDDQNESRDDRDESRDEGDEIQDNQNESRDEIPDHIPEEFPGNESSPENGTCGCDDSRNLQSPYIAEFLLLDSSPASEEDGDREKEPAASGSFSGKEDLTDDFDDNPDEDILFDGEDGTSVLAREISGLTDRQKEALMIAGRIRELVGVLPVRDETDGKMRPARYSDIVILLRSTVGWNEDIRAVFEREGIPVYADSRTGYFAAEEIRTLISMLRVLDNPRQDIPLYSALRGYFGHFDQDELALIHLTCSDGSLYDALNAAAASDLSDPDCQENGISPALQAKCLDFLAFLRKWRAKVQYCPITEIVNGLLEETGYQDYCTALPGGAQRSANLRMFQSQADAFTRTEFTGLFQFLRYIDGLRKLEIDYGEANTLDENADVVRLMTIHKSKGLEFPVCIVAGLSGSFSFKKIDASGPVLYDGDWGLGINYFDVTSRVRSSTLRKTEIAEKIRRDCMGEELRVLYVAMTRAKEKLILTACKKGLKTQVEGWLSGMAGFYSREGEYRLSPFMIGGASSYAELICEAVMAQAGPDLSKMLFSSASSESEEKEQTGPDGAAAGSRRGENIFPMKIRMCSVNDLVMEAAAEQLDLSRCEEILRGLEGHPLDDQPDPEAARALASRYFRLYPHEELRDLYAQTSVSELKHRAMRLAYEQEEGSAEGAVEMFPDAVPVPYIPEFIRRERGRQDDSLTEPAGQYSDREGDRAEEQTGSGTEMDRAEASMESGTEVHPGKGTMKSGTEVHRAEGAMDEASETSLTEEREKARQAAAAGARRGTAFHRTLELLDYSMRKNLLKNGTDSVLAWIHSLTESGALSREDAGLINPRQILGFLRSSLAGRMEAADQAGMLFREQPFVMGCSADRVSEGLPKEETVMIQGIIDAFFMEEGSLILVDYKTDRVSSADELIMRYNTQLELYAEALGRAYEVPVREKIIYSTFLGKEILL